MRIDRASGGASGSRRRFHRPRVDLGAAAARVRVGEASILLAVVTDARRVRAAAAAPRGSRARIPGEPQASIASIDDPPAAPSRFRAGRKDFGRHVEVEDPLAMVSIAEARRPDCRLPPYDTSTRYLPALNPTSSHGPGSVASSTGRPDSSAIRTWEAARYAPELRAATLTQSWYPARRASSASRSPVPMPPAANDRPCRVGPSRVAAARKGVTAIIAPTSPRVGQHGMSAFIPALRRARARAARRDRDIIRRRPIARRLLARAGRGEVRRAQWPRVRTRTAPVLARRGRCSPGRRSTASACARIPR